MNRPVRPLDAIINGTVQNAASAVLASAPPAAKVPESLAPAVLSPEALQAALALPAADALEKARGVCDDVERPTLDSVAYPRRLFAPDCGGDEVYHCLIASIPMEILVSRVAIIISRLYADKGQAAKAAKPEEVNVQAADLAMELRHTYPALTLAQVRYALIHGVAGGWDIDEDDARYRRGADLRNYVWWMDRYIHVYRMCQRIVERQEALLRPQIAVSASARKPAEKVYADAYAAYAQSVVETGSLPRQAYLAEQVYMWGRQAGTIPAPPAEAVEAALAKGFEAARKAGTLAAREVIGYPTCQDAFAALRAAKHPAVPALARHTRTVLLADHLRHLPAAQAAAIARVQVVQEYPLYSNICKG